MTNLTSSIQVSEELDQLQDAILAILTRRYFEKKIDGYLLPASVEIAETVRAMRSKDHSMGDDDVERLIELLDSTEEALSLLVDELFAINQRVAGGFVSNASASVGLVRQELAALVRSRPPIDRYAQPCSLHEYIQPNCPACGKLESAPMGDDVREKYEELIYAVSIKHPQEDRHETALRYIRQAEAGSTAIGSRSIALRTVERKPFVIDEDESGTLSQGGKK